ncbi:MAG: signal peptidase I [Candidatus Levybacteria bacterium]|nr:signal peptidase I [Candidatus Levybacteria bacterium]
MEEQEPLSRRIISFLVDGAQTILLAATVFLVIYIFLFRPFQVSGLSMYPNFDHGEFVLTSLISTRLEDPKRGDVIVFKSPIDKDKDYIKRVIAIPEDRVMIQEGSVYLNGEKLDESKYLADDVKTYGGGYMQEGQEVTVPENMYFMMGDNRSNSSDSREWGPIKKSEILGKSMFVYWPVNHARAVKNPQQ